MYEDEIKRINDETNAIMLSGECAMGDYPIECVEAMDKIHICLDLLVEQGYIERKETLKERCSTFDLTII